jgi:hypothetical protein
VSKEDRKAAWQRKKARKGRHTQQGFVSGNKRYSADRTNKLDFDPREQKMGRSGEAA